MKITLISVYESVISYGLRSLSAVLKQAGFETRMVFLPRESEGLRWTGFRYPYSESVLDQLSELCQDSELVGISVMSNYFDNAVQVTERLRKSSRAAIVWGGIHPTVRPEECLAHADVVCVGEGEDALCDLARQIAAGQGWAGIDNMWYRDNGQIVRTPLRPLSTDLDSYPYPDYEVATEYVLDKGTIRPMTSELMRHYLTWPYSSDSVPTYTTMMSRGCSYHCSYCCNNALRNVYAKRWPIRRRSVPNFVGELREIVERFPWLQEIKIEDDVFIQDVETLRQFKEEYTKAVGLPLFITGFQPPMVTEERMSLLVAAGMKRMRVGLQTGSMRTMREVYRRPVKREQMTQAFQVLRKYRGLIDPPMYDLIGDNPWEAEDDQIETLRMLLEIPKPYQLLLFSLTFYPGTELYERARTEGLLQDDVNQVYRKDYFENKRSYLNGLFKLFQIGHAPSWLMSALLRPGIRRLNWVWLPYFLQRLMWTGQLLGAGWRALRRRDWGAFERALRTRLPHPISAISFGISGRDRGQSDP